MTRDEVRRDRGRPIVLTPKGRLVLSVLAVVAVLVLVTGVRTLFSSEPATAGAASPSAGPTSTRVAHPSTTTAPPSTSSTTHRPATHTATSTHTASSTTSTRPSRSTTSTGGIPHSGLVGDGTFTTSSVALSAARRTAVLHTFVVEVEGGVKASPDDVARQIERTLNDPRGWIGYHGASFAAVSSRKQAEFVIYLASPPTVDRMCAPLNVLSEWNCEVGKNVVLNSDRWFLMTPTYSNLTDYRSYMVNHEIGHFLGRGHVGCPKAGSPAPVMLRQSMSLEGCVRNAWPREADIAG